MKKILIADDQEAIRRLVSLTLSSSEYEILEAENGDEAIRIAIAEKPDLIIMDIMMPGGIDGLEATRIIKNDPDINDCPVLLLTGKGEGEDRKKGFEAGANDYFSKPFSPLELIRKVEEYILG